MLVSSREVYVRLTEYQVAALAQAVRCYQGSTGDAIPVADRDLDCQVLLYALCGADPAGNFEDDQY